MRGSIAVRNGETDRAYRRDVRTISPATMKRASSRYMDDPGWMWIRSADKDRNTPRPVLTHTDWINPRAIAHR